MDAPGPKTIPFWPGKERARLKNFGLSECSGCPCKSGRVGEWYMHTAVSAEEGLDRKYGFGQGYVAKTRSQGSPFEHHLLQLNDPQRGSHTPQKGKQENRRVGSIG